MRRRPARDRLEAAFRRALLVALGCSGAVAACARVTETVATPTTGEAGAEAQPLVDAAAAPDARATSAHDATADGGPETGPCQMAIRCAYNDERLATVPCGFDGGGAGASFGAPWCPFLCADAGFTSSSFKESNPRCFTYHQPGGGALSVDCCYTGV